MGRGLRSHSECQSNQYFLAYFFMGFQFFHYFSKPVIGLNSLFEVARVFLFLPQLVFTDTILSSRAQKRAIMSLPSSKPSESVPVKMPLSETRRNLNSRIQGSKWDGVWRMHLEDYRLSMGVLGHRVRERGSENIQCDDFDCQLDRTLDHLEDKPWMCV